MNVRAPTLNDLSEVLSVATAVDMDLIGETDFTLDSLRREWRELDLEYDAWIVEVDAHIVSETERRDSNARPPA